MSVTTYVAFESRDRVPENSSVDESKVTPGGRCPDHVTRRSGGPDVVIRKSKS